MRAGTTRTGHTYARLPVGGMLLTHVHAEQSLQSGSIQSDDLPFVDQDDRGTNLTRGQNELVTVMNVGGHLARDEWDFFLGHQVSQRVARLQARRARLIIKERNALDHARHPLGITMNHDQYTVN